MYRTLLAPLCLLLASTSAMAVPMELSHQGRLLDSLGDPLDGDHSVTIALYSTVSGGSAVWEDTWATLPFYSGYYNVKLGGAAALDLDDVDYDELYVGISIDGDAELTPRQRVVSVPYALMAQTAQTADTAANVSGGTVTATEVVVAGNTVVNSSGLVDFNYVSNLPAGLDDGVDDDTLATLGCDIGEVALYSGTEWGCVLASAHLHDASAIDTGIVDIGHLPVGDTDLHVARGDHTHGTVALTTSSDACDASTEGLMRYNPLLGVPEFCDGAVWSSMGGSSKPDLTIAGQKILTQDPVTPGRTTADGIAYRVQAPADSASDVVAFDSADDLSVGFSAGDEALLISMQGVAGDIADVGSYEIVTITGVAADTISFDSAITKSYDGAAPSEQKVVLQRLPTYGNVHVPNGASIRAANWDGLVAKPYRTGIIAFRATGSVMVDNGGLIAASGSGYQRGQASASGYCKYAYNGEGVDASLRELEGAENTGGGEGGDRDGSWCVGASSHSGNGGGGGSYGTAGTASTEGSAAGATYGDSALDTLFLGGAGGGGSAYRHSSGSGRGGHGGNGGGILFMIAGSVMNNGAIAVTGDGGENYVTHGGGGGGGAGGSARIITSAWVGAPVNIDGGSGGTGYSAGAGGDGGDGRANVGE